MNLAAMTAGCSVRNSAAMKAGCSVAMTVGYLVLAMATLKASSLVEKMAGLNKRHGYVRQIDVTKLQQEVKQHAAFRNKFTQKEQGKLPG